MFKCKDIKVCSNCAFLKNDEDVEPCYSCLNEPFTIYYELYKDCENCKKEKCTIIDAYHECAMCATSGEKYASKDL